MQKSLRRDTTVCAPPLLVSLHREEFILKPKKILKLNQIPSWSETAARAAAALSHQIVTYPDLLLESHGRPPLQLHGSSCGFLRSGLTFSHDFHRLHRLTVQTGSRWSVLKAAISNTRNALFCTSSITTCTV